MSFELWVPCARPIKSADDLGFSGVAGFRRDETDQLWQRPHYAGIQVAVSPRNDLDPGHVEGIRSACGRDFSVLVILSGPSVNWIYLSDIGYPAEQLAGDFAVAFDGLVLTHELELEPQPAADRSRETALAAIRAALWTSEHPYDRVTGYDNWINRAVRGEPDALQVVQFWARSRKPVGPAGHTRKCDTTLGQAILRAAEGAAVVPAGLVHALAAMTYLPLLEDKPARQMMEKKADSAVLAQCIDHLNAVATEDRRAREVFERAKANGDYF